MAKRFTFTGAFVRHAAIALATKDGSKTVRVDFTVAWTAKVRESLNWTDLKKDQDEVHLNGSMNVLTMSLEVGDKAYDLGSGIFKDFKAMRVDDGKKRAIELRGQYICHERTIAAKVESYAENSNRAKGSLVVSYDWASTEDGNPGEDDKQTVIEGTEQ